MKVLIADGDAISRLTLTKIMDMEEIPYIEESDGKGALDEYKKDKDFGMVIIEWDLMGMDGLEVVKGIRDHNKTTGRDCYIIMISERSGKWDIQKAVEMGF